MMDEQLIDEVAHHSVIYNRQKYYLNGSGGGGSGSAAKYETKDEAWQVIAMKLRTDVETCKKRWKYLRERYVSQRKQGDPPVYEHLSRPYLEKMKFLDQHIQPRKSYRNVPSFLTSPHSGNSSNYIDYNMDSKSNGSLKNMSQYSGAAQHHYHQQEQHPMNALSTAAAAASALESSNNSVKIEADQVFRDFAAAVASQQFQQMSQSQIHHQQAAAVAAAMADSSQSYQEHFRDVGPMSTGSGSVVQNGISNATAMHAASSPVLKSPLASPVANVNGVGSNGAAHSTPTPQQVNSHTSNNQCPATPSGAAFNDAHNDELDCSASSNYTKKPRVQLNSHVASISHAISNNSNNNSTNNNNGSNQAGTSSSSHFPDDSDDDSDDNSSTRILQPQTLLNEHPHHDNHYNNNASSSTSAAAVSLHRNNGNTTGSQQNQGMFPSNADFLFQLYQQLPHQAQQSQQQHPQQHQQQQHYNKFQAPSAPPPPMQRTSEHLLGELVTTELLKMTKERRKHVQKRILEILFFED